VTWLLAPLIAVPFALMLWWPDAFAASLDFTLRSGLALLFPVFMHAFALWVVYLRAPNRIRPILMGACLVASVAAFSYLWRNYNPGALLDMAVIPVLYIVAVLPYALKQRSRGNT
jgi:hypothetical protein